MKIFKRLLFMVYMLGIAVFLATFFFTYPTWWLLTGRNIMDDSDWLTDKLDNFFESVRNRDDND